MSVVQTVAVVGAGVMGSGIAQVAARSGLDVRLLDASRELGEAGLSGIARDLERLVSRERISAEESSAALGRIRVVDTYEGIQDADFMIEAVAEDLEVKSQVFHAADRVLPPHAILATNTSSLSPTKLAAATQRPHQVVGMHFFNPAPVMQLVEVVRALQTDDETFETARQVAERMGKIVLPTKDMPGFAVNRLLMPLLSEACLALQEGMGTPEEIDRGVTLGLNHPMGPFQLMDLIGLDVVLHIMEVLHREFGEDRYAPPVTLRNYVAAGLLGRKTGRGFYDYSEGAAGSQR